MKIGFIGLGKMGHGMAANIARSGAELIVFDTSPEAVSRLVAEGASAATNLGQLARDSDVIFTSLPGPPQVETVVLGSDGVLDNVRPGTALFDLSTSSFALANKVHAAFHEKGAFMLDAPISGGPAGAATRDLVLWVGGEEKIFDANRSVLDRFSKTPKYVGPIGAGTVTKLSHNLLGYMMMLAQAEVFSMAAKAGIDALNLWEALRLGVVGKQSPLHMLTKQFLPGKFETPAMALKLAHKDVTLATALARELGVPMRLASMTMDEMTEALGRGFGEWDSRAFLQLQVERAGVTIAVEGDRLQQALEADAA